MIITFTANPSIDVTLDVPAFTINEVNRSESKIKDPAGKGINVARALKKNGAETAAIFPADATNGAWIVNRLAEVGIDTVTTPIRDEVRTNITIVDDANQTTKINEAGPMLSDAEQDALLAEVAAVLDTKPTWLVAAGSLPRGLDGTFYVRLGELAHERGVLFAVDTSGEALATVAHAGIADLMKPNHEELEDLAGKPLPTVGEVVGFAQSLLRDGAAVLVSLGENGAILVTAAAAAWAGHDPVTPDSTVGAGDSSLAGYLFADMAARAGRLDPAEAASLKLTTAVAWGAAAVQLPGTTVPGPTDISINAVHVMGDPRPEQLIEELSLCLNPS